jgi:hypothetical protein
MKRQQQPVRSVQEHNALVLVNLTLAGRFVDRFHARRQAADRDDLVAAA